MASLTAERETVVVEAAKTEDRAKVDGQGVTDEARAWNARAQVD